MIPTTANAAPAESITSPNTVHSRDPWVSGPNSPATSCGQANPAMVMPAR
jgi:hypothetical protein